MTVRLRRIVLHVAGFVLAATVVAQSALPAKYTIETAGSQITWELPATLHTVRGTVPKLSGTVETTGGLKARVVVEAAPMATGNEKRDATMREKVLEVAKFPEIVFESEAIQADSSKLAAGQPIAGKVKGTLTVHGKALPIESIVQAKPEGGAVILTGSFALPWKQYGLWDPSFGLVKVREPLQVTFRLRAIPAS
ncbi:MAG TPA: YceI family protein [Thermoanaerobaculia bacterium]